MNIKFKTNTVYPLPDYDREIMEGIIIIDENRFNSKF